MNLSGKHVAVTGAGGFIGSHLVESLVKAGTTVRAFTHYNAQGTAGWLDQSEVRQDVEVVAGDLRDPRSVREAISGCDIVFHLGALIAIPYSYKAPGSYIETNVKGTLNVLEAARDQGLERVVHTSTSEVYGSAQTVPIAESHPLQAQSPYAASKIAADKLAESFHLSFGVPVTTVRPFNTFGPRQSARAIIPAIITQCLAKNRVELGSLHPTRDLNFVDNTVSGFLALGASDSAVGKSVNLGSGVEISIGDLADLIVKISGKSVEVVSRPERGRPEASEVTRLLADASLAADLAGWRPEVDLTTGIEKTISWIEQNMEYYRPGEYVV